MIKSSPQPRRIVQAIFSAGEIVDAKDFHICLNPHRGGDDTPRLG